MHAAGILGDIAADACRRSATTDPVRSTGHTARPPPTRRDCARPAARARCAPADRSTGCDSTWRATAQRHRRRASRHRTVQCRRHARRRVRQSRQITQHVAHLLLRLRQRDSQRHLPECGQAIALERRRLLGAGRAGLAGAAPQPAPQANPGARLLAWNPPRLRSWDAKFHEHTDGNANAGGRRAPGTSTTKG